ncbi:hypothetical protein MASR2M15_04390 [Anaerolineales bacterium]
MKISIGMQLQSGPFGGGNQFGHSLVQALKAQGIQPCFDLKDPQLDLILLAEPRKELQISAYTDANIWAYLKRIHPGAIVVHRINECDERKGSEGVNQRIIEANRCADHTVFVSKWLQDLYLEQGIGAQSYSVIHNGSDTRIFNSYQHQTWSGEGKLKIVTHHWGANWLKGFDIYAELDRLLGEADFAQDFEFTYIGNLPEGFELKHSRWISPLNGSALASALRENHVYLSASQNEPGPNHQNEGANCGLPLVYRPSGGLSEYCDGFGIAFEGEGDFKDALYRMRSEYSHWQEKIASYPFTAEACTGQYLQTFKDLLAQRDRLIKARDWQAEAGFKRYLRGLKRRLKS